MLFYVSMVFPTAIISKPDSIVRDLISKGSVVVFPSVLNLIHKAN